MTPQDKPIANPMLVFREEFDDWAVLFDPDTGDAFGLNPVCVFVWKCLDGKNSIEDIYAKVRERCDGVSGDAEQEIADFIEDLVKRGYAGFQEA